MTLPRLKLPWRYEWNRSFHASWELVCGYYSVKLPDDYCEIKRIARRHGALAE